MKTMYHIGLSLVILALLTSLALGQSFPPGNQQGNFGPGGGQHQGNHFGAGGLHFHFWHSIFDQLTAEQRALLQKTVSNRRATGAGPAEIHTAVTDLLESWEIELPEYPGPNFGSGPRLSWFIFSRLSPAQRTILCDTIQELRENNAAPEEIQSAVLALLTDWGIELPEDLSFGPHPRLRFLQFIWNQLTVEQQATLRDTIQELSANDASPEEIHTTIRELLADWDIELPAEGVFHPHLRLRILHNIWHQLTDDQRQTIHQTVQELHAEGATPTEIRAAILDLLNEWGFNEPGEKARNNARPMLKNTGNFPNPFNPDTHIAYTLNNPAQVKVSIFDTNGRLINTLTNAYQAAGNYNVYWNGKTQNSRPVPSGIYFYRINAGQESITQGMILMK